MRWPLQPLQPFQQTQLQPPFGQSVASLCHPWFTTTNFSYRFPIFETSATALCGTTGIRSYVTQRSPPNFPRHYVELEVFLLIYIATFTALQEQHAAAFGPVPAAPGGEHRWTVGLTEEEAVVQQHLFLARHRGFLGVGLISPFWWLEMMRISGAPCSMQHLGSVHAIGLGREAGGSRQRIVGTVPHQGWHDALFHLGGATSMVREITRFTMGTLW